jgi:peroxiredoxin
VDDATVDRYKRNEIDLEKSSGEKHHVLPVPTVYVVDAEGKLQFSYINPDFKARVPGSVVLEAAKVISQKNQYLKPKPKT